MAMEMMTNDSMDSSSDRNRVLLVSRQPRESRSIDLSPILRHGMGKRGTEFAVYQITNSLGSP